MTQKRRLLLAIVTYLLLWGGNRVVYHNYPGYQQHPEEALRYLDVSTQNALPPGEIPHLDPHAISVKVPQPPGRPDHLRVGQLRATIYHAVPAECDANPFETADGSHINPRRINELRWCAVSQDLLHHRGGPLRYGDTLKVSMPGSGPSAKHISGLWVVHDAMNARHRRRIDFLVPAHSKLDPTQGPVLVRRVWKHIPGHPLASR